MLARYALSSKIASFDFFTWLVQIKAMGATGVAIDMRHASTGKWDFESVRRRVDSILLPGCELAGLPVEESDRGEDLVPKTDLKYLVDFLSARGRIEPLCSVLPPVPGRYTVTIRDTTRVPARNSDQAVWRQFAAEIGARVIEDYDVEAIGLHERVALYAGAEMNFFVPNGPMFLCGLTPYPVMCFDCHVVGGQFAKGGLPQGRNYPWFGPEQHLVWEPDELPVMRRHFSAWREARQ